MKLTRKYTDGPVKIVPYRKRVSEEHWVQSRMAPSCVGEIVRRAKEARIEGRELIVGNMAFDAGMFEYEDGEYERLGGERREAAPRTAKRSAAPKTEE